MNIEAPRWYALKGDLRVDCVVQVKTKSFHPQRIMKQWGFVYVHSGQRTLRIYGEDLVINAGEFFLLPSNVPHYGLLEDVHEAYYIHFMSEGNEVSRPTRVDAGKVYLPLYGRMPDSKNCEQILDYTARHCLSPYRNACFMNSQVSAILYQISYFHQRLALSHGNNTDLTDQILRYIQDNYSKPMCSEDYEAAFGKTYKRLNTLFSNQYGRTIKQMQINIRINQSKLMLSAGYTIAETSQRCGFDDYLYFLKAFHKIVGMTPKTYQEKLTAESRSSESP